MSANIAGLWPPFRVKVEALLADPEAKRLGVYVVSAFRDDALQTVLYADAVRRYGGEAQARKWVAPPGRSNHGPRVDEGGNVPGPYGRAVDFGVAGVWAVSGRWPIETRAKMQALGRRYQMHQAMPWEDWHYEPDLSLYIHAAVEPAPPPPKEAAPMAMVVIDPKSPADAEGRLPNWESDEDGNLYNWNGARFLQPLHKFTKTHPPIVAIALESGGDGVVLFGNDTRQEPDGRWVRSTYKITVGM